MSLTDSSSSLSKVSVAVPVPICSLLLKIPAVLGNAVLYRNGVPIAAIEAGTMTVRAELPDGAHVDANLVYRPPPQSEPEPSQVSLPWSL